MEKKSFSWMLSKVLKMRYFKSGKIILTVSSIISYKMALVSMFSKIDLWMTFLFRVVLTINA